MIEFKNITKKFVSLKAVDDLCFTIKPGEIIGLLGPNGAGKTTALRMLAGVLPPSQGEIFINRLALSKNEMALKKLIGYLPENNPLYQELTVEEFLKFWLDIKKVPLKLRQQSLNFVVERVGIKGVFYRPISELSKGYRQRVGLAQAILTKPKILILDEPTEGLDPNHRLEIKKLIRELGKKRTVIISSHVLAEINEIANRLIILNKGKIVADASPHELQQLKGGNQIIELEIKGQGILSQLKKLKGVIKATNKEKNYFILETDNKNDVRPLIFNLCKKKSWQLLTMFKKEVKLEDVFSQLITGANNE